jgi:hypothetical protein
LNHYAAPSFWKNYELLPVNIRELADECYEIIKSNLQHPSLHFKKIGIYRTIRIGLHYRALAVDHIDGLL